MTIESNVFHRFQRGERKQLLIHADLTHSSMIDLLLPVVMTVQPKLIYSDPPWNPGNEKYWRNHAGASESKGYEAFLDAWWKCVHLCETCGAEHLLVEQSVNPKHRQLFMDAAERSGSFFRLIEEFVVYYGSPGSQSVRRPNALLHFAKADLPEFAQKLRTDPSTMAGEPMTIRACAGLVLPAGSAVIDCCMGKGMTSRMAHYFDWDCIGIELNAQRLQKTIEWLLRQGYVEAK